MNKIKHCKHGKTNFVYCADCKVEHLEEALKPLDGHDYEYLLKVAERLKGSDGEGWAVGEMLERVIALKEVRGE
jgi:hypothetical protein